ncbi:MAG TPA: hypothetical protein VJB64_03790 [Patescibacteria group bacterium]|nr:hypothetical protein [Patescibacteria group bacterium]
MNAMTVLITLLIVGGLFAKHSSFILMYGSVFEELRAWIHHKRTTTLDHGQWFYQKSNELITCQLCLTAQVSIWFVALPVIIILEGRYDGLLSWLTAKHVPFLLELAFFLFAWFVAAIVNAAVAMAFWNLTEHLPAVLKEMQRHNQVNEEALVAMVAAQQVKIQETHHVPVMTFYDFRRLIERLSNNCDHIGCPGRRRECRQKTVAEFVKELTESLQLGFVVKSNLDHHLNNATREYHRLRRDVHGYEERIARVWNDLEARLPVVDSTGNNSTSTDREITLVDFRQLLQQLDGSCSGIDDSDDRRTCRTQRVEVFASGLAERHMFTYNQQNLLTDMFLSAAREFFQRRHREEEADLASIIWDQYQESLREIRTAAA